MWVEASLGDGGRGDRMTVKTKPSWGTWWVERMDIFQNKTMINIERTFLYQY